MKISIIPALGHVYIDGQVQEFSPGEFAGLAIPPGVHAVQFDTDAGHGHIEWQGGRAPNTQIDASFFQQVFGHAVAAHGTKLAQAIAAAEEIARLAQASAAAEEMARRRGGA